MPHLKYVMGAVLALTLAACSQTSLQDLSRPQLITLRGVIGGSADAPTFRGKPLEVIRADVTLNGAPADEGAVQPGVVISGRAVDANSSYEVERVDVKRELKGTIQRISTDLNSLTVRGQRVNLDASTVLVGDDETRLTAADLCANDRVDVYGVRQADGSLLATRVERRGSNEPKNDP